MSSDKLPNYQAGQVSLNHGLQSVQVFQASSDLGLHVSGKSCKHSPFCIASLPSPSLSQDPDSLISLTMLVLIHSQVPF